VASDQLNQLGSVVPWAKPAPSRQPGRAFVAAILVLAGVAVVVFVGSLAWSARDGGAAHGPRRATIGYDELMSLASAGRVQSVAYDSRTGVINGVFAPGPTQFGLSHFRTQGQPHSLPVDDVVFLAQHHVVFEQPPAVATHEPLWERALEWSSTLHAMLVLLAMIGVGGLIVIRHRAAQRVNG
jgi:hypothetical protein